MFSDPEDLYGANPAYGRMGLSVHRELAAGLCDLEGAAEAILAPNGLAACALAIASALRAGDHALVADNIYGPTRRFCERRLDAMGISITRFDPRAEPRDLAVLIQDNTRALIIETPGSLTFELVDTPALVAFARERGLTTILDNTWSAGLFHKPMALGVDLSVQALTKYIIGHADGFGGAVMCRTDADARKVRACADDWGLSLAPEEAYSALRGLRTLETRLARHGQSGFALAHWLEARDEVACVLHPGLESHAEHMIWQRDFSGASGLFGFVLKPEYEPKARAFLMRLKHFAMGFSWGGYESLLIPCDPQLNRTAEPHLPDGPLLRVHVGLEAPEDLIADLTDAFSALHE